MNRINYVNLLLGRRGTGKTYYLLNELIPTYQKHRPDMKILIMDTFENPGYKHIAKIDSKKIKVWVRPGSIYKVYGSNTKEILADIQEDASNMLIIFEDATKYIKKVLQEDVRKFIIDSKQKNLDLIFLFHGFSSTPPELFRLADTLTMFRTDNPIYRKSDIIEYDLDSSLFKKIKNSKNKYAKATLQLQ